MLDAGTVSPQHDEASVEPRARRVAGDGQEVVAGRAELLAFRAPYLEEKLVNNKTFASREEGAEHLQEVKKYLLVCHSDTTRSFPMASRMVDEVWHQFVLFTTEYTHFSKRFFGHYVNHTPGIAPPPEGVPVRPEATRAEFFSAYEALFGPVPSLWDDVASVGLHTRVLRDSPVSLEVRVAADRVELVEHFAGEPHLVVRVDAWGEPALRFVVNHDIFYVRELPGRLHPEDKVLLVRALLRRGAPFHLAP